MIRVAERLSSRSLQRLLAPPRRANAPPEATATIPALSIHGDECLASLALATRRGSGVALPWNETFYYAAQTQQMATYRRARCGDWNLNQRHTKAGAGNQDQSVNAAVSQAQRLTFGSEFSLPPPVLPILPAWKNLHISPRYTNRIYCSCFAPLKKTRRIPPPNAHKHN